MKIFSPISPLVDVHEGKNLSNWNYFLSLERDVYNLNRYIEFCEENFSSFSIENARIIMASVQEIDVLLKQICIKHQNPSQSENGYRNFFLNQFPRIVSVKIEIPKYQLQFQPFSDWSTQTPKWWTANNKIKHHRNNSFPQANLLNVLTSVAALFIVNLYYYKLVEGHLILYPGSQYFTSKDVTLGLVTTAFGYSPYYIMPT